jgi:Ca2+-binding RTX toxin-like protein
VQVHAEVPFGESAEAYLAQVLEHAAGADTVGFAVFPIGPVMGAVSPYSNGAHVSPTQALADYAQWLEIQLPDKSHVGILQGFGLRDLFTDEALLEFDPMLVEMARAPTQAELLSLYAELTGMDGIYWAGTSYLDDASDQAWLDVLAVSHAMSGGAELQPIGALVDLDGRANVIAEDAAGGSGTRIKVEAIDPDTKDAVSYSVDDPRFTIAPDGNIVLKEAGSLDFGVESSVMLTVTATSADGSSSVAQFELSILDTINNITGSSASEELIGTLGADVISGAGGHDWLWGVNGNDRLEGGWGNDHLLAGFGNDTLNGGAGSDVLVGEEGDDVLSGGAGVDLFVFAPGHGNDTIVDFEQGLDKIVFFGGVQFADLVFTQETDGSTIQFVGGSVHLDSNTPLYLSEGDFFFV